MTKISLVSKTEDETAVGCGVWLALAVIVLAAIAGGLLAWRR
ncbi:MAG: hypothetical protein ABJA98_01515 [Acidobacteriota bacterium]